MKDRDRASMRRSQLFISLLVAALLATFTAGQCTTPDPEPFGVKLNQDLSIAGCLPFENVPQPQTLINSVRQWLPEYSNPQPSLLSTSNNPNLVFTTTSTIYITFVDEGAGYRNSLGYFVYDSNNRVISKVAVFPDVSTRKMSFDYLSADTVRAGDTVQVGPFAAGTRVGFFLIGNGFNNEYWRTDLSGSTYWTIDSLNPDKKRHIAMFKESTTGKVLIGIEDLYDLGDADYNDAVFFVEVDGRISNNQFPVVMLVTTPLNTDARVTLESNEGKPTRAVVLSLPSRGTLSQVNPDGTKGAPIEAANTAITSPFFHLIYSPARGTFGSPYTTFTVNQHMPDGQIIFVSVRVDVLSYPPYAPVPMSKNIDIFAGEMKLIQLEANDAQNLNVYATITRSPYYGVLYQYNSGVVGAPISSGVRLTDPLNRLYYQHGNPYATARGSDNFVFTVTNNLASSAGAVIQFAIDLRPNRPPSSQNIVLDIKEDESGLIEFVVSDPDRDPITVTILNFPIEGRIFLTPDGSSTGNQLSASNTIVTRVANRYRAIFVPNANRFGAPLVTYRFRVSDYRMFQEYTVTINVQSVNDLPTVTSTSVTIPEDSVMNRMSQRIWSVNLNPDMDNTQAELSIVITSYPEKGTLKDRNGVVVPRSSIPFVVPFNTEFFYEPTPIQFGTPYTSFSYQLSDPEGGRSPTATFVIHVFHVNHPPQLIVPSSVSVDMNTPTSIFINARDVDVGDTVRFRLIGVPWAWGWGSTLTMDSELIVYAVWYTMPSTGVVLTFTPYPNHYYDTSIHIQIWDSSSSADSKIIPIRVNYGNIPPIAYSYVYYTHEDTPRPIGLYATDANRPVEVLKYVITTLPTRGFLMYESVRITSVPYTLPGNSTLLFLNDPYSFGIPYATFSYVANDGRVNSAPATITVGVYHVNHAPLLPVVRSPIVAKRYTPQTFTVSLNDMDSGDTVAVIITLKAPFRGRVLFGSITVHNGYRTPFGASGTLTLTYIPPPEVAGVSADYGDNLDTISFRAIDNYSWTSSVLDVPINVEFVPRAPVIATNPTSISVPERDSIQQIISTKDEDSRPVTVTVKLAPAAGRLFLLDSSNQPTGDALTAGSTIFTAPGTGSASVLYSSPQPSSLTVSSGAVRDAYTLSTNNGARSTDLIVNVQVADKNFAPFISATPSVINMQQAQGAQSTTFVVSGGDPDGDMISAVILSMQTVAGVVVTHNQQPISVNTVLEGSLRAHSWGLAVSIPALTRGTVARINIEARDSAGLRSQALELLVEVTGVNFSPSALTTTAPLCLEDEFVDIELTASDDNGDVLEIFISQLPSVGTLTFQGQAISDAPIPLTDGMVTIRYAPPLLTYGSPTSSFRYFVSDGRARSSEVTIPLNVQHVNHAPRLTVQTLFNTEINVPATILINAQDVDSGDSLTLSVTSLPTKDGSKLRLGSQDVVLGRGYPISSSGLALVYQPSPNTFYDDDAIEIRLSDGMVPITQRIAIKVNYLNILPVASPQTVNATEDISSEILLSGTDDNIPSEQLTFIIATLPTRGILRYGSDRISTVPYTLSGTSALTFTNDQYSYGAPYATFSFVANDGRANSPAATVTINVAHVNHPPILQSAVNAIQTSRSQLVPILIVAQDFDIGNSLTATINSVAEGKGTLQLGGQNLTGQVTKSISGYESLEFTYTSRDAGEGEITEETFFTVSVQDGDGASADIRINITVKFDARPPIPLPISVVQLPERGNSSITLGGSDQDQLPVELWIETRPSKGSLYYLDSSSAQKKIVEFPFLIVSLNTSSVSTTLDYVHEYSGTTFSVGAESDSFSASIKNDDLSSTIMINIRITDVNFAPTISSPLTRHSIPDAQLQRSVSFKIAGADPDNDELDAEITRHTQENIVISQNGLPIQLGNPLSKSSDGTWSFQVTVPALTVGVIDRITAVVTDGDLRSQELEFVVETTSTNFAPVALTTSVDTFLEDSFIEFSVSGRDDNGNDVLAGYVSGFPSVGVLYDGNGAEINTTEGLIPIVEGMMKLKYVPPLYTYGSPASGMRYYVTDGRLRSEEVSLLFNIQHVNHAPVARAQNLFNLLENGEATIQISFEEIDSIDNHTIEFHSLPESLSVGSKLEFADESAVMKNVLYPISRNGLVVKFVAAANRFFENEFTFGISDSQLESRQQIRLVVQDVNSDPIAYSQSITMEEDSQIVVTLTGSDSDVPPDPLSFILRSLPPRGTLFDNDVEIISVPYVLSTNEVIFKPIPVTFGAPYSSFSYSVSDGKVNSTQQSIVFNVTHVNHAPRIRTSTGLVSMERYTSGEFSVSGDDLDIIDTISLRVTLSEGFRGKLLLDGQEVLQSGTFAMSELSFIKVFEYFAPQESENITPDYGTAFAKVDFAVVDDSGVSSESKTVVFDVSFVSRTPSGEHAPLQVILPEREAQNITLSASDLDDLDLTITLIDAPRIGSLIMSGSNETIASGSVIALGKSPNVVLTFVSPQPLSPLISTGEASTVFSYEISNGDKYVSRVVNVTVEDVNFAPTISSPLTLHSIPDAQLQRSVSFKIAGADPDNDELDAYILSRSNDALPLMQNGTIIDITEALSKSSDGTWSFQVTVPTLTVGVIDRITAVVTDGDLRSQELEFVVETTPTNFAPVALTTSVDTFLEDSFIEFSVSGRDDNGNDVLAGYVSGFPSVGVLYDGNGAEINTTEGLIPIVEGMMKLKYVPPLYTYGSPASGMRYYVTDGRLRSEEVSLLFNIQHVNHAPVSTIQSRIINVFEIPHADEDIIGLDEGEGVVILSGFDVDLNDTVRVYLNEIPPLSLGKLLINDTVVEEIPVDGFPLNTEIGFQPEEYVSGLNITRFSYYISDGIVQTETVTVEINIVDINHEPEVYKTEAKIETEENTAVEFSLILEEYAKDFDGDEIHVFVSEPSSNGSLSEFSRQGSGSSETWTITYTPSFDLSAPTFGDGFDSFEVSFGDGKTVASRKVLVSVDVKDKNFAPTGDNVYVNVKEVSEYTLDFSGKLEDIDNDELSIKILNLPSDGAVIVAGRTLVQSDIPVIVSSTQLTDVVISRGDSEIIDVFFEYTVFDGTIESEAKYNISVYILGYLNYPPVAVLDADYVEIPENKRMPISWGGFDRNGDTLSAYITELPSRGSLHQTSNGISVGERISVGDVVLITDKWRVMYQPESYDATGPFSFSFYLNDSQAISPVAKIEIGVTDVNYPPTCFGQPSIVYMEEDGEALIKLKGVDQDNDKVSAQLTAEPSRGLLFLADASGSIIDENPIRMPSSLEVYEFPASNNGEWYVLYRPPADKSGNGYSRFYFRVVDTQSEASVETVVLINVRAVNDPPTIVAPTNITTISTSPVSVKGVSVKEVDSISPSGVAFSATITADIGLISVSNIAGATIKPDDFATGVSSISISASYATLNQALSSLVYIPPVGVNGTTSINITVSDNGNTGIGPAYTTTAILAVEITSPADEVPADDSVTSAIAGGAVGATAAIAGAFWVFKKVTQKEDYNFTIPEKEGDTFASNPLYDANSAMGAMHSNPLYDSGSP